MLVVDGQRGRSGVASAIRMADIARRRIYGSLSRVPRGAAVAAGGAIGLQAPFLAKKARSALSGVITRQKDFYQSKASKSFKRRKRRFLKKLRRTRRRLNRVLKNHYRMTLWVNMGRSWGYASGKSSLTEIWFWSHRGDDTLTTSDNLNALSGTLKRTYTNLAVSTKSLLDTEVFFPSGSASNTAQNQWWWKQGPCTLDVTITNTGGNVAEPTTNRTVEYEIYKVVCIRRPPRDPLNDAAAPNMLTFVDLKNYLQSRFNQGLGSGSSFALSSEDAGFTPYMAHFIKKYLSIQLIGRGQLPPGDTMRFNTSHNPKIFYNYRSWADEYANADSLQNAWVKGAAQLLLVTRGLPTSADPSPVLGAHRLTFMINWRSYIKCHSVGQENQRGMHKFADAIS